MVSTTTYHQLIYEDILKMVRNMKEEKFLPDNLFKGAWGALFYLFYYEQYIDDSKEEAVPLLEELYNSLQITQHSNFTYCNGLSGPFWLLHHLNKHEFIELDLDDLASDFITAAIAEGNYYLSTNNFDFLHGSAGIANLLVVFQARPDVRAFLERFAEALMRFSVTTPQGRSIPMFYYHTDPPSAEGVDAFSLAHGTCSLQLIMMKIHKAGIARELCSRFIYESMAFVLAHEFPGTSGTPAAMFPSSLNLTGEQPTPSRISWCYGDVNVAIALWYCGKYFQEEGWKSKALEIMHTAALRNTMETGGVVDACLCHGTAGNAAIFRRFWHETGDPVFYQCSEDWYELTHQKILFSGEEKVRGIRAWQGKDDQWQFRWDLLDGSAGTGLALLSRISEEPLPWDEFLLLS